MAEERSTEAQEDPRYLVEIPFRAARNGRLTEAPYDLPGGARIEATVLPQNKPHDTRKTVIEQIQGTYTHNPFPPSAHDPMPTPASEADPERIEYRYVVTLRSPNAEEAMAVAEAGAKALLDAFAANQMALELKLAHDRYIKCLDPPTDPVPDTALPMDTLGMRVGDEAGLAQKYDPTGERRRQGMVFKSDAVSVVSRPRISLEAELYASRDRWDDRIRRAAEIYRLAQCSDDEAVRFLMSCLALEVLVAHDRTPVLKTLISSKRDRRDLVEAVLAAVAKAVDAELGDYGLSEDVRKRIAERVRTTEAQGYVTSAATYLEALNFPVPAQNLARIQKERGGFVHAGERDDSSEGAQLRNDFVKVVGVALLREMATVAGRATDDLVLGTTFTWLQVWDFGDGESQLLVG